jgi:hypothetical protein
MYTIAESKFVITAYPQNNICPCGRTYVMKVAAMVRNIITTRTDHI